MNNKTTLATVAAFVTQVIFGFGFMFAKIGLQYASPLTLIADRYITAFLGLTVVMLLTRKKIRLRKNAWKVLLMALFQPVLYYILEIYGIALTTSAFSSVMVSLIPAISMIFGRIFLGETSSFKQYMFTALSIVGVVIIALMGNADGTVKPLGVMLLFFTVLSSVGYSVTSRKISGEFDVFERTYIMTAAGAITFTAIAFIENFNEPIRIISSFAEPSFAVAMLYLGIVSSVGAFLLLNFANTYLPVAKTMAFSNITTVVSVVSGAIFLDEKISIVTAICVLMIIAGVWGVQVSNKKDKK